MNEEKRDVSITPPVLKLRGSLPTPTVWASASWAPEWFEDALREARQGKGDRNARRREIVFAVCCAESYLFEWIRDAVLKSQPDKINTYFPPGDRRGVWKQWKDIPKQLKRDGMISEEPDFGGPHGVDWNDLIDYRDGLIHARASRPLSSSRSQPEKERPNPPLQVLDAMEPGWAVRVVVERIRRLHEAAGTPKPSWAVEP